MDFIGKTNKVSSSHISEMDDELAHSQRVQNKLSRISGEFENAEKTKIIFADLWRQVKKWKETTTNIYIKISFL